MYKLTHTHAHAYTYGHSLSCISRKISTVERYGVSLRYKKKKKERKKARKKENEEGK